MLQQAAVAASNNNSSNPWDRNTKQIWIRCI
jgi:hypothetical protein